MNSVLNFAFITKRLNQQISAKHPSVYLHQYEAENAEIRACLSTHFIDEKAFDAAKRDDFREFVTLRGSLILEKIQKVCLVGEEQNVVSMLETDDEMEELYPFEDEQ